MNGWAIAVDDRLGPHFVRDDVVMLLDGVEWMLRARVEGRCLSQKVHLRDVVEIVPQFRAEAVGMMRAAMEAEADALRGRLTEAEHALDAGDYAGANHLIDNLQAWPADDAQRELHDVGEMAP